MKIIQTGNFNRDEIGDKLIAENVDSRWGARIVNFLNYTFSRDISVSYFILENDEYKLKEDFVP